MRITTFRVVPALPERLRGLREIAYNLRWSPLSATRDVRSGRVVPLDLDRPMDAGAYRYAGTIPRERSGVHGYSVRVRPSHPDGPDLLDSGLISCLISWRRG